MTRLSPADAVVAAAALRELVAAAQADLLVDWRRAALTEVGAWIDQRGLTGGPVTVERILGAHLAAKARTQEDDQ